MKTVSDPGGEIEFVATEDSITASLSHLREAPIWRGSVDVYSAGMIEGWIAKANNFLAVTSRKIVGLFPEQLWFQFVPVLHRLQGGPAAQG